MRSSPWSDASPRLRGGCAPRAPAPGTRPRARLALAGIGRRPGGGLAAIAAALAHLPPPPDDDRRILLVLVGTAGPDASPAPRGSVERESVETVVVDGGGDTVGAVRHAIEGRDHDLVCVMRATTAPVDDTWLARLAEQVRGDVVAAVPVSVHPRRDRRRATPHDELVRSAGLLVALDAQGLPEVRAAGAGKPADPHRAPQEVDAASAACVLVDRAACRAAGGLPLVDDLDTAIIELCLRLHAGGGRILVVPGAVVIDRRPVATRQELDRPVDPAGRAWRATIDRNGPALVRAARSSVRSSSLAQARGASSRRFVVTVAAPSAKVAQQWGDWHLAEGFAAALRRLGNEVRVQTADLADHPAGRVHDVHLVLRGLTPVRRTPGQVHVLWIISHPESIEDEELDAADLVMVASPRFAEHLRDRTSTPVEVLLQATDQHRFHPRPARAEHRHAVTVVAKTRDVLRPAVADALSVGLRPRIYGAGWRDLVDPSLVVADHVDNIELPAVYASAGVVLNDHWRTMQRWGFVSNRLYDVLACGTPVISDPVAGLAELFDGGVPEYHDPRQLRKLVDAALSDPAAARAVAERGRAAVIGAHTFDHRATELIAALDRLSGDTWR